MSRCKSSVGDTWSVWRVPRVVRHKTCKKGEGRVRKSLARLLPPDPVEEDRGDLRCRCPRPQCVGPKVQAEVTHRRRTESQTVNGRDTGWNE